MHGTPPCLLSAWSSHAPELKRYLDRRLGDADEAADLLQDAFIKALRQGRGFCAVRNPRAWLFQVARNTLTDRLALTLCDIEGQPQQALADRLGLSLPAAKSRLQRARTRLQRRLVEACQVRFDEQGRVCGFTPRATE